jgi:hypothetical protein
MDSGLARETEVFGENMPQCHFVHHKSHMTRPGLEAEAAAAAVGNQRITASAMSRPSLLLPAEHTKQAAVSNNFDIVLTLFPIAIKTDEIL